MKRKYQKPTSLDLGDVLLTAHGSCKSGGLAGNNSCVNGGQVNNPSDPGHCENGSVAFQGPGKCKNGSTAEAECNTGTSAFQTI